MFSCEFYEISKNTSSYRTPPMTASIFSRRCQDLNRGPGIPRENLFVYTFDFIIDSSVMPHQN